jgi:hypothetical protein
LKRKARSLDWDGAAIAAANLVGAATRDRIRILDHLEQRRFAMAKGQMRSNKEKKKPKQDKSKKDKGGPPPSPFAAGQGQGKPGGSNPSGKK